MKHFFFLIMLISLGGVGSMYNPFWGLLAYYTLAVLRPQHLWNWSLPVEWRWSLIAALLLLVSVALHLSRYLRKARPTLTVWLILIYGFLLLMSCLTAYDPSVAQNFGIEYAKVLLIAVVASFIIEELGQVRLIAAMILLVIGYLAWEVNSLYFFNGRLDIFHYGYSGLDNNGAGLFIAMGIPLAYAFGQCKLPLWQRIGAWCLGLFMLHAVMMSYSRGAMLSALVGCAYLLVKHRPRLQAIALAAILAIVISLLAGNEIQTRFLSTTNFHRDDSAQARFDSWSAAWDMIWDSPILGKGIRNSNQYSYNYGADMQGRTIHSQYLQIAADTGLPAMLVYLAILITAWLSLHKTVVIARDYLQGDEQRPPPGKPDLLIQHTAVISTGLQGSLLIFCFGAIFLSVEVVELPWILIVLASVLPRLTLERLEELEPGLATELPIRVPIAATLPRQRRLPSAPLPKLHPGGVHP